LTSCFLRVMTILMSSNVIVWWWSKLYYCGLYCWPKCYHILNWFFLPKLGFWEFIWIFSSRNHLKSISPTFWIQILPINFIQSCSSRSFQEHQKHLPILSKFSATIDIWALLILELKIFNICHLFFKDPKDFSTITLAKFMLLLILFLFTSFELWDFQCFL